MATAAAARLLSPFETINLGCDFLTFGLAFLIILSRSEAVFPAGAKLPVWKLQKRSRCQSTLVIRGNATARQLTDPAFRRTSPCSTATLRWEVLVIIAILLEVAGLTPASAPFTAARSWIRVETPRSRPKFT